MTTMDYDQMQLVAFRLAAEEYAVPVQNVEGIIKLTEPTKVPGSPPFIRGVINLRGKVISILDLRRRFLMHPLRDESDARVLVVHHDGKNVGILVDEVSEVLTLDTSTIQPPPPEVVATESRAVEGLCNFDERLIIILDLGAVLEEPAPGVSYDLPPDAVERAQVEIEPLPAATIPEVEVEAASETTGEEEPAAVAADA